MKSARTLLWTIGALIFFIYGDEQSSQRRTDGEGC